MNDSYNPKSKFNKFMEGKGFYIALAVCVVGAGTAAWVAVNKTISRIDESNSQVISEQSTPSSSSSQSYGFPDLEEAGKAQSGVGVASSQSASSKASASSTAPSASSAPVPQVVAPSAPVSAQPTPEPSSFVLPMSGEIFAPYSNNELVKNITLKEWRTHDGIDIKAEKGTQIKSVCDGKVLAVHDDPLMGMTVEIQHENKLSSIYCGLDKQVAVKEGETVKVGQPIGTLGEVPSEISLDPHLHFAMKSGDKWVNPLTTMGKIAQP